MPEQHAADRAEPPHAAPAAPAGGAWPNEAEPEAVHEPRRPRVRPAWRLMVAAATLAGMIAAYALAPADMPEPARRTLPIFLLAAVFWATELIPLYATSLVVVVLEVLLLSVPAAMPAAVEPIPSREFLAPFASDVILLFMGGFFIARAVSKHGVDRVVSSRLLAPTMHSPALLLMGVLGITAWLSMWMSNTATAAMMLAIVAPVLASLPRGERFGRGLILAVPFGANIGGIGTPIGTPPNAIAIAALRRAGEEVSFIEWMIFAVPLEAAMLLVVAGLLYTFNRPSADLVLAPIARGGRLGRRGVIVIGIVTLAGAGWLTQSWHGMGDAVVALLAAALLAGMRLLDRTDVNSLDWDILILMWGGLSLGVAMESSGMLAYLAGLPIAGGGGWVLAAAIVLLSIGLSTFISNTAAANLLVPMALALSSTQGRTLAVLAALGASLAMALPISTPPNAMAFATGRVSTGSMLIVGALVSLLGVAVLLLGYGVVLPLLLR